MACWAIGPAVVCERRLREAGVGRGRGLVLGVLLGPIGVAAANFYLTFLCLALTRPQTRRSRERAAPPSHDVQSLLRGDLLAFACLAATLIACEALSGVGDAPPGGRVVIRSAAPNTQRTSGAAEAAEAGGSQAATALPGPASAPYAPPASVGIAGAIGAPDNRLGAARVEGSPSAGVANQTLEPARAAQASPTAGPAQSAPQALSTPVAAGAPAFTPAPTSPSAAELTRLVVPPGLGAHGAISGAGNATTLTIACAECTREQGVARLSAGETRAALRAAGVRVVVLVSGQESWTFML